MEFDASYSLDDGIQFWDKVDDILAEPCDSQAAIDNVLRHYLALATKHGDAFLPSIDDILRYAECLLSSPLFTSHADYIRRQIVYSLLQEDTPNVLLVVASLLLYDGRQNEATFELMSAEGAFVRLLELIRSLCGQDGGDGAGLHRLLMDLMYEMSRIQRIRIEDLVLVEDEFIKHLFHIIEEFSDDANDPYHYPVIRVLLVLNEQFMVSAHHPAAGRSAAAPLTNKVIKVLSMYGSVYKTFGENIILLLNRETETSLQLLTLKLLYLLFTTPSTCEYFYTNDLRVLVDILIRNLLDLPEEASALRHTYLRVLHPLLANTQLRHPPHYKREELRKLLGILVRSDFAGIQENSEKILHFDEVDETTKRLVLRCSQVEWLVDKEQPTDDAVDQHPDNGDRKLQDQTSITEARKIAQDPAKSQDSSPSSSQLSSENSAVGGGVVASQNEVPDAVSSDRKCDSPRAPLIYPKRKPEPPKSRRWRSRRRDEESDANVRNNSEGKNLERQTSFERVAESEPPTPPSYAASKDISSSTPRSDTQAVPSAKTPPPVPVPRIRVKQSSFSSHPPAVPPPRRSSHSVPPPTHLEYHPSRSRRQPPPIPPSHSMKVQQNSQSSQTPVAATTATGGTEGHPRKPDPPKKRRWWTQHAQQQSNSSLRSSTATTPSGSTVPSPKIMTSTALPNASRDQNDRRAHSLEPGLDKLHLGQG
ncbi:hypothetical protein VTO42DRAFT_2783 [Malbranchea cinnamomea]